MDSSSGAKRGGAPLDALLFHLTAFDNNRNTAGKEDSRRFRRRRSSRNADTYRRSLETLSTLSTLSPCHNRNMTPEAHWRASASRYLGCVRFIDSSSQRPLTLGLVLSRNCRYQPSDLGNSGDGRRENLVFFQIERHVHYSTHKHTF